MNLYATRPKALLELLDEGPRDVQHNCFIHQIGLSSLHQPADCRLFCRRRKPWRRDCLCDHRPVPGRLRRSVVEAATRSAHSGLSIIELGAPMCDQCNDVKFINMCCGEHVARRQTAAAACMSKWPRCAFMRAGMLAEIMPSFSVCVVLSRPLSMHTTQLI